MKLLDCGLLIAAFGALRRPLPALTFNLSIRDLQFAICNPSGLLRWILNDHVVNAQRRTSRPL